MTGADVSWDCDIVAEGMEGYALEVKRMHGVQSWIEGFRAGMREHMRAMAKGCAI